jgi:hypothetical protein
MASIHLVVDKRVHARCGHVGKSGQILVGGEKGTRIPSFAGTINQIMGCGVQSRAADVRVRIEINSGSKNPELQMAVSSALSFRRGRK